MKGTPETAVRTGLPDPLNTRFCLNRNLKRVALNSSNLMRTQHLSILKRRHPSTATINDASAAGLLHTSLVLSEVVAPELKVSRHGPVSLTVGLQEFVLLAGLTAREADYLLRLAATLRPPSGGRIFHWGQDLFSLPRNALYLWRARLAFVSPFQSLLPRLTVLENITLSQTLLTGRSPDEVASQHQVLLNRLDLMPFLADHPRTLPVRAYHLALWARELLKQPELILGLLPSSEDLYGGPPLTLYLLPLLQEFHARRRGAILLAGPDLASFYHAADRLVRCREDVWQGEPLPGRANQPLIDYLNLL
ncbi:hypothetical protein Desac_1541 [Desulfobacca acetoxidans DSM 11109]|uniref:ABC transporter domain-containing protein n=2 Tax=Desulfobacca acetoxidans TaxID=60893 RepID=F2NHR1_DESAR|nr:hypothetical protein Desac_1541 [Desulfobacca acetoxidans DSM 11109]